MELTDYIRLVRRNWVVIVALTMVGLVAGVGTSEFTTKRYTAETSLYISVQSADSDATVVALQGGNAAQQKVKSYIGVVTSDRVLEPVRDTLGLRVSLGTLAGQVSASTPSNSVILNVAVTNTDPAKAAAIANAIGKEFSTVISDQIEKPIAGGPSLVRVETIKPASVPGYPTSPRKTTNAVVGLMGGGLAGLLAAFLRTTLDVRIRGTRDLEDITTIPILGGISNDPHVIRRPLIVREEPRSPRAEAFRALRTNLRFVGLADGRRTFVTTSAMPAEGKSTTTANLAITLAEGGHSVALIDADLRRPRMAELMGIEGAAGLSDLLIGSAELDDVLQPWGRGRLTVLPAGSIPPNPSELLGSAGMKAVIDELSARFDYVLIDTPPVLPVTDAAVLGALTSGVVLVVAANKSSRLHVKAALTNLDRVGATVLGSIVTMLPANAYGYSTYSTYYGNGTTADQSASEPQELPIALDHGGEIAAPRSQGKRVSHREAA